MTSIPTLCLIVCIMSPAPTVTSDFCEVSRIMRPSRSDTAETIRQIAAHNAKYRDLCSSSRAPTARR